MISPALPRHGDVAGGRCQRAGRYARFVPRQITLDLNDDELAAIDRAVAEGRFSSIDEALREALAVVIGGRGYDNGAERERDIEDAYRRAYERHPQEPDPWLDAAARELFARLDAEERATGESDTPR